MKNSKAAVMLALSTGLSTLALTNPSVAMAATSTHHMQSSKIVLNGSTFSTQYKFVGGNPSTTYMPIYYVQQLINKVLGTNSSTDSWDGTNHTWSLTVFGANPKQNSSGSGAVISVNGIVIEHAPTIVDVDPASGQSTTFMPIWYVQQLLNMLLNLNSGTDVWNGGASTPTWTITTKAGGNIESQANMANAMWNVFNSVNWDVNTHPSQTDVGITPSSTAPVTANDVATWLAEWAGKAKGYKLPYNVNSSQHVQTPAGTFIPFSLQYESSTDPYTWANEASLFQGTSVTSSNSVISTSDASQITSNLKWWLTGDRVVNGVHHLHVPMYGNFVQYDGSVPGVLSQSQYEAALANAEQYYDQLTATVSGTTINLTLPNVSNSSQKLVWDIVDGSFEYGYGGGPSRTGDTGGLTLHVPNNNKWGPTICVQAFSDNLMGWSISYPNQNGQPNFSEPKDGNNEQSSN